MPLCLSRRAPCSVRVLRGSPSVFTPEWREQSWAYPSAPSRCSVRYTLPFGLLDRVLIPGRIQYISYHPPRLISCIYICALRQGQRAAAALRATCSHWALGPSDRDRYQGIYAQGIYGFPDSTFQRQSRGCVGCCGPRTTWHERAPHYRKRSAQVPEPHGRIMDLTDGVTALTRLVDGQAARCCARRL